MRISDKFIRDVNNRIYSLPMNLDKHQLYLLEQHSESFKIWSGIIRINTEGKSSIMKLGPGSILLAAQNHSLILISLKFTMDC